MTEYNNKNISIFSDLNDLDYLRLSKLQAIGYDVVHFFKKIPTFFVNLFKAAIAIIKGFFVKIKDECVDIVTTFTNGDWKTKVSYLVMGFGSIARGQILRGLLFLVFEIVFIVYMAVAGFYWLGKYSTLGTLKSGSVYDPILDTYVRVEGDNSFKILLYGTLTILFIIAFIYTWRLNVKQNRIAESILKSGKKLKSGKEDLQSMMDDE